MSEVQKCPKCQHEMSRGFIADDALQAIHVSRWVEGEPERSLLWGTKAPRAKSLHVTTYRCMACGFLESYARHDVAR